MLKGLFQSWGFKKKLYAADPLKKREEVKKVEVCSGKEKTNYFNYTPSWNESEIRNLLAQKITGSYLGAWLLVPEFLLLKTWSLAKSWTGKQDHDLEPRLALQLVNEAAMCVTRMRRKQSLGQPAFEVVNGLPYLATDAQIHYLLDAHTIEKAKELQIQLARIRLQNGHFPGESLALDPHRLISDSERAMVMKKFSAHGSASKILQTFFAQDPKSGQPVFALISCPGKTATNATWELQQMADQVFNEPKLFIGDKEHCNEQLFSHFLQHPQFDLLTPCLMTPNIIRKFPQVDYNRNWAGYAIGESVHGFKNGSNQYRMIVQRFGEREEELKYSAFLTTSSKPAKELMTDQYPSRWHIEEFFRFEQDIGWKNVKTWNQNIRFGKMSLALIAQAALFQFKQRLPANSQQISAATIAEKYLRNAHGDIKVKNDKIIITFYNMSPEVAQIPFYQNLSQNLENMGIDPRIPWLYGFKPEFRFK